MENNYKLRYLSLFFEDANEIASYIVEETSINSFDY